MNRATAGPFSFTGQRRGRSVADVPARPATARQTGSTRPTGPPKDKPMSFLLMPNPVAARRPFLGRSGLALSGAVVALLAGRDACRQGGRRQRR